MGWGSWGGVDLVWGGGYDGNSFLSFSPCYFSLQEKLHNVLREINEALRFWLG